MSLADQLMADLREAEAKAWDALARYKFFMFGYHAADVVKPNRRLGLRRPNPFAALVMSARHQVMGNPASIPSVSDRNFHQATSKAGKHSIKEPA